jgi:hypothetical protein
LPAKRTASHCANGAATHRTPIPSQTPDRMTMQLEVTGVAPTPGTLDTVAKKLAFDRSTAIARQQV